MRQAKVDTSYRVKVSVRQGLAIHLYRVLKVSRSSLKKNERTKYLKRTQGIMQAERKTVLPKTNLASKIAMCVDGNEINGSEANT